MKYLAIDPGSTNSGFVVYCSKLDAVLEFGKIDNKLLIRDYPARALTEKWLVLIEKPDYLSMGAGKEVVNTIFFAGMLHQAFRGSMTYGRQQLKSHFKLKNDAAVISFIKLRYPHIKLKADSWQAFLLIHAYEHNVM